MSKKISKSNAHANLLIESAKKIRAEYQRMIEASKKDASLSAKERIEDIALFDRKIAECDKMISWWSADIASNNQREIEKKKSAESEKKKSAEKASA